MPRPPLPTLLDSIEPPENEQVLWQKNRWRIELFDPSKPWRGVFIANGVNGYHAIEYDDGSVAYDFPERVPKYVRKVVSKNINEWVRGPG